PYLRTDGTRVQAAFGGTRTEFFDYNPLGGTYAPRHMSKDALTQNAAAQEFTLATSAGAKLVFNNFDASLATSQKGQLKSVTDPNGNTTSVTSLTADGKPQEVQRTSIVGGTTTTESYLYAYIASGTNAGKIDTITERRQIGAGSWTTVRTVTYTYH